MTTYQDPPLQSRRAARQSERGEAVQPQYPDALSSPLPSVPDASISRNDHHVHSGTTVFVVEVVPVRHLERCVARDEAICELLNSS